MCVWWPHAAGPEFPQLCFFSVLEEDGLAAVTAHPFEPQAREEPHAEALPDVTQGRQPEEELLVAPRATAQVMRTTTPPFLRLSVSRAVSPQTAVPEENFRVPLSWWCYKTGYPFKNGSGNSMPWVTHRSSGCKKTKKQKNKKNQKKKHTWGKV